MESSTWVHSTVTSLIYHFRCRGSHDLPSYLASKPPDLQIPVGLLSSPPWIEPLASPQRPFLSSPGTDISTRCPYFDELGECKVGFKCRFLGAHVREDEEGQLQLVKNSERIQWAASNAVERNGVQSELLKQLRKREVRHPYFYFIFSYNSSFRFPYLSSMRRR